MATTRPRTHRISPQHPDVTSRRRHLLNSYVSGWMQYYGAFYRTDLYPLLRHINHYLMRWIRKKYRIRTFKKFHRRWKRVTKAWPLFFAHWKWVHSIW